MGQFSMGVPRRSYQTGRAKKYAKIPKYHSLPQDWQKLIILLWIL
jgi:hypothetical protein